MQLHTAPLKEVRKMNTVDAKTLNKQMFALATLIEKYESFGMFRLACAYREVYQKMLQQKKFVKEGG